MWKNKWLSRLALVGFLCLMGLTGGGSANEPKQPAYVPMEQKLYQFVMNAEEVDIPQRVKVWKSTKPDMFGRSWKEYKVYEHVSPVSTRDFVIEYTWHFARIFYYEDNEGNTVPAKLVIGTATRREFVTPGYCWLIFTITDWFINGEVYGQRSYWLFDDRRINVSPDYPDQIVEAWGKWYNPSQEVVVDKLVTELKLWEKVMEGLFDGS